MFIRVNKYVFNLNNIVDITVSWVKTAIKSYEFV